MRYNYTCLNKDIMVQELIIFFQLCSIPHSLSPCYSLGEDDEVPQYSEHLVGARGLVESLEDGTLHLCDGGSDGGPGHLVVPPFQEVVQGTG